MGKLLYLLSFLAGRGALFAAPLLLANLVPLVLYGQIEGALAAASLISVALALGTSSAVPLVLSGRTAVPYAAIVQHHGAVALVSGGAAAVLWVLGAPLAWSLTALLTATILLQTLLSVTLKSAGQAERSLMVDAGLFLVLVAAAWGTPHGAMEGALFAGVGIYTLLLLGILAAKGVRVGCPAYGPLLRVGLPLMGAAFVALATTSSGRLLIGWLGGPVLTADYAVLYRATAAPLIAHQLLTTAAFRSLFTLDLRDLDRRLPLLVLGVGGAALAFWLLLPLLGPLLGPVFVAGIAQNRVVGMVLLVQTIPWSAMALNEQMAAREGLAGRILPWTALALALGVGAAALTLTARPLTLLGYVHTHAAVVALVYSVQVAALAAYGVRLWRLWGTVLVTTVAVALLLFIIG